MGAFNFKLVPGEEDARVPVAVVGRLMVNIQSLLSHIGRYLVTDELSLQGTISKNFLPRFTLCVDDTDGIISSSVDLRYEYSGTFLDDALAVLIKIMDIACSSSPEDISDIIRNPRHMLRIKDDIIKTFRDLEDFELVYGIDEDLRTFNCNSDALEEVTGLSFENVVGVICKTQEGSICLFNRNSNIPLTLDDNLSEDEITQYLTKEVCVVSGTVVRGNDCLIKEVTNVCAVSELPYLAFDRIISAERDFKLTEPIVANLNFDRNSHTWTLSSDLLGVSVSKHDWDIAVTEFHDHIVFLWEIYAEESNEDLSDEEIEIRDRVLSLKPLHAQNK
jgi:hypothetical protein